MKTERDALKKNGKHNENQCKMIFVQQQNA